MKGATLKGDLDLALDPQPLGWQPIETAPKQDGLTVLLDGKKETADWCDIWESWLLGGWRGCHPTHWHYTAPISPIPTEGGE